MVAAPPADLVIENARIWSDGRDGLALFAAVSGGRFVAVGDPDPELIGPDTERIDAGGRTVVPGLIDTHTHMLNGGRLLARLQLRPASDRADFIDRVRRWADTLPPGGWILGGRWSVESWDDPEPPTKEWIDLVTAGRPAYLRRMDGHSALVNSVALARAGITRDGPPDPPGGTIDRDPVTGEPTGILRESAEDLVTRLIPPPTLEDELAALRRAIGEQHRWGITTVGDIPELGSLPVYARLARSEPGLRFHLYVSTTDWPEAAARAAAFAGRDGWVRIAGLKAYMDGSLGSRTAVMREAYLPTGDDGSAAAHGLWAEGVEDGRLQRNLVIARDARLQPIVHAIGDEANHRLLSMLAETYDDLPAARARSEHAQHLLPEDIERFATLGVIASMQPYHKTDDGRYAESYIGAERCRTSYAFRSLLDAGVVVAFGSDWPVVTNNPWLGIEAATIGRTLDGRIWQPQERIDVTESLRCYTSRAAYALGVEREIGRIAVGYRADFVILTASPFDADVAWDRIAADRVFVEGRKVFPAR